MGIDSMTHRRRNPAQVIVGSWGLSIMQRPVRHPIQANGKCLPSLHQSPMAKKTLGFSANFSKFLLKPIHWKLKSKKKETSLNIVKHHWIIMIMCVMCLENSACSQQLPTPRDSTSCEVALLRGSEGVKIHGFNALPMQREIIPFHPKKMHKIWYKYGINRHLPTKKYPSPSSSFLLESPGVPAASPRSDQTPRWRAPPLRLTTAAEVVTPLFVHEKLGHKIKVWPLGWSASSVCKTS